MEREFAMRELAKLTCAVAVALAMPATTGAVEAQRDAGEWQLVNPSADFAPRDGAGAVVLLDRMWILGGWNRYGLSTNDVWNSVDGFTWTFVGNAPWERRHYAGYVVYQDKMWIVGGDPLLGHYQNDVWNSPDGINWTRVEDDVPWGPRVLHHTVVFDDKIWVMGGQTLPQYAPAPEAFYNDVWYTTDGVNWTRALEHAPWSERGMIGGSVVLDGKIWILGGGTYDTPNHPTRDFYNDVWCSSDGVNWTEVSPAAPWEPRQFHDVAVFDNKMWVMEGYKNYQNLSDVWYSEDGASWYELEGTPWGARHAASVFVHQDCLWMVAGNMWNDVWKLPRSTTSVEAPPGDGSPPEPAPTALHLYPSWPNPAERDVTIAYGVPVPGGRVRIQVHDVAGRAVRTLVDRETQPGTYNVQWDRRCDSGRWAPAGIYYCRLEIPGQSQTRKLVLIGP